MPLDPATFQSDLMAAMDKAYSSSKDLETAKEVKENRSDIFDQLITDCGKAYKDYLVNMQDLTTDNPQSISKPPLEEIFSLILDHKDIEDPNINLASLVQSGVQSQWSSLFPMAFQTNTPPPDGAKEVTAIGALTTIGSLSPAYNSTSQADFVSNVVTALAAGATTITVTISYVKPDGTALVTSGLVS